MCYIVLLRTYVVRFEVAGWETSGQVSKRRATYFFPMKRGRVQYCSSSSQEQEESIKFMGVDESQFRNLKLFPSCLSSSLFSLPLLLHLPLSPFLPPENRDEKDLLTSFSPSGKKEWGGGGSIMSGQDGKNKIPIPKKKKIPWLFLSPNFCISLADASLFLGGRPCLPFWRWWSTWPHVYLYVQQNMFQLYLCVLENSVWSHHLSFPPLPTRVIICRTMPTEVGGACLENTYRDAKWPMP